MQMPCLFSRVIEPPSLPGTAARWKRRSSLITQFNNLFRKQYINTLRQLTQNYTKKAPIKPGDIVIVDTESSASKPFPLGQVIEVLHSRSEAADATPLPRKAVIRMGQPASKIDDNGASTAPPTIIKRGLQRLSLVVIVNDRRRKQLTPYTTNLSGASKANHRTAIKLYILLYIEA